MKIAPRPANMVYSELLLFTLFVNKSLKLIYKFSTYHFKMQKYLKYSFCIMGRYPGYCLSYSKNRKLAEKGDSVD